MTPTDKPRFVQAFNRLAVATRLPPGEVDGAMQRIYFEGLEKYPIEAVEDAARQLAEEAEWFPKLAQWSEVAEKARNVRALTEGVQDRDGRVWHAECGACDDTGWEPLTCNGSQCGRRDHAQHIYVVPCPCRLTNKTYQRRLAEQRERTRQKARA